MPASIMLMLHNQEIINLIDKLFVTGGRHLGDQIIANGLINWWSDRCLEIHYPAVTKHFKSMQSLYRENPRIKVIEIHGPDHEDWYITNNGGMSRLLLQDRSCWMKVNNIDTPVFWDMDMYDFYNLPFSLRYTNFRMPSHIPGSEELYLKLTNGAPYILVHNRSSIHQEGVFIDIDVGRRMVGQEPWTGLRIDINEDITDDFMQYVSLVENATEIHCIPSSLFCLVDSMLNRVKGKIFVHDVRAQNLMKFNSKWNGYRWNVVNYETKI